MATIKARGHVAVVNTKIPGERSSGQYIKLIANDEGLTVSKYKRAEEYDQTGALTLERTEKGKKAVSLTLQGKLTIEDHPPTTADGVGVKVMKFRPGARLTTDELHTLHRWMPTSEDEQDELAVNINFKDEQNEMDFEDAA